MTYLGKCTTFFLYTKIKTVWKLSKVFKHPLSAVRYEINLQQCERRVQQIFFLFFFLCSCACACACMDIVRALPWLPLRRTLNTNWLEALWCWKHSAINIPGKLHKNTPAATTHSSTKRCLLHVIYHYFPITARVHKISWLTETGHFSRLLGEMWKF